MLFFIFLGNLSYQTSRQSYWNRRRKTWESEPCHHFHSGWSTSDHRHEPGSFRLSIPQPVCWFKLCCLIPFSHFRTTTLKRLSKWEMCYKNLMKVVVARGILQFWVFVNTFLLEGIIFFIPLVVLDVNACLHIFGTIALFFFNLSCLISLTPQCFITCLVHVKSRNEFRYHWPTCSG